jgi:hypothetical protein
LIIAHGKPRREFKDFKDFTKDPRKGGRSSRDCCPIIFTQKATKDTKMDF